MQRELEKISEIELRVRKRITPWLHGLDTQEVSSGLVWLCKALWYSQNCTKCSIKTKCLTLRSQNALPRPAFLAETTSSPFLTFFIGTLHRSFLNVFSEKGEEGSAGVNGGLVVCITIMRFRVLTFWIEILFRYTVSHCSFLSADSTAPFFLAYL